ncbi:MAG: hypothetical protein KKB66_05095 [Alphaproteobacteria bacterium]|uniref:Uncharacterized protein n=1 Tax=viral metagenome TaxID=1070528 RepID=A0A6H1ZUE3_9ZZZZ|nr:hypothetical protein [Alphaproteobacteria bacterium]MBU0803156.1 hypothetical protein [Alphaproteobacteria bacterium]MBU0873844.1 hypothetical protein [Alphaproteobacteria bacterium]MBU1400656.1 hypothetical protein [Alphaproteobacteria bacterium]MBU1590529.1 hypothetical protein [Alphaproteobacteria bacterium]
MKLTMQLTLDGLIRALRLKAHALAEDIEAGYADVSYGAEEFAVDPMPRVPHPLTREQDHASARR